MTVLHNMSARGIRNRYLKDLFIQWRGTLAAYDEAAVKGDAWLAAAVWRNLFKADEDVDWEKVALVVSYMRRMVRALDKVSVEQLPRAIDGSDSIFEICKGDIEVLQGSIEQ